MCDELLDEELDGDLEEPELEDPFSICDILGDDLLALLEYLLDDEDDDDDDVFDDDEEELLL